MPQVERHKLKFKILTNTALTPTDCTLTLCGFFKNTNDQIKNKSQKMQFKSMFTTRKQKVKDHVLYTLRKNDSIRQTFIKSCYEPGTVLTSTTVI